MTRNVTPISTRTYTPAQVAEAASQAQTHRAELHAAGHAEGKHEGLKLAGRYRDIAVAALGFMVGTLFGGLFVQTANTNGIMAAGAIADRVLSRTVDANEPFSNLNSIPADLNAHAPAVGCAPGQVTAPGRRCPPEPASAPRR